MTRAQFAQVVRADEKWVDNTARGLRRVLAYTPEEARWLGLVRVLTRDFGIPILRAADLAAAALCHPPDTRALRLVEGDDGSAALVLDLARFHSGFTAALASALHHGGPRQPGRRSATARAPSRDPLQVAVAHGVDVSLLREGLGRRPAERLARLDANAAFLRALRPTAPGARRAVPPLLRVGATPARSVVTRPARDA